MDWDVDVEIQARGELVRVRWISDDAQFVGLEFRGGIFATGSTDEAVSLNVGDVAINDHGRLTQVPAEMWLEDSYVAVVRLKKPDVTILDSSGNLKLVPTTTAVDYSVGNTVEARSTGVVSVLSPDPIRFLDLPAIDDTFVEQFIYEPSEDMETLDDFGGNREIVKLAGELIETLLKRHDKLVEIGVRPIKGILFTGDPGTGKTMLARIISSHAGATFYKISGPEVVSKWVGQSEEVLRRIFEHASRQPRAIVFFDEIDSVAAKRDEEAHESSKRFVAQLLALMDGFTSDRAVIIATTNRPGDIDPALRRAGRFDWEIVFPVPNTSEERESILRAAGRKMKAQTELPHSYVADQTRGWTPADLAGVWREAALLAVSEDRAVITAEDYIGGLQRMASRKERASSNEGVHK